jgi:septal ring factor EnvC (AmiA/AmiB activator)
MVVVRRRKLKSSLVWLAALPWLVGAAAVDRDLEGIRKKIDSEKKELSELKAKEGSVRQSLGKIESDLKQRSRELKTASAKLTLLGREVENKRAEAARLDRTLTERQDVLSKRALALYRWQRGGSVLALLHGAESLRELTQRKHYLQVALSFDQDLLAQMRQESERQAVVRRELADKHAELENQKQVLGAAQEAVRQEAEKKKVLLASLGQEKAVRQRALRDMEAAAQRLARMLNDLSRRAVVKPGDPPPPASTGRGLDPERGRLEWPVRGDVSAPYGKFKHPEFAAEIVRKGIDIDAPAGDAVKAVERGRVAYADPFAGYGNMIIVDHGERFYTVYGHLAQLLKKKGDEVRRGEPLGRVGEGDIYFEMRKDGHSVDPLAWLMKQ